MKEKPILFNAEMVKAILDGRKTQSRRPVKDQGLICDYDKNDKSYGPFTEDEYGDYHETSKYCPFGQIGDHLYVRETFRIFSSDECGCDNDCDCRSHDGDILFYASIGDQEDVKWKPSIHMPKKYARIWLEITDIRVERVIDITEDEALKEGIISNQDYEDNAGSEDLFPCPMCNGMQVHWCLGENMGVSETDCIVCDSQKNRFSLLWDSIYDNWSENPWVWVIEFKRINK